MRRLPIAPLLLGWKLLEGCAVGFAVSADQGLFERRVVCGPVWLRLGRMRSDDVEDVLEDVLGQFGHDSVVAFVIRELF